MITIHLDVAVVLYLSLSLVILAVWFVFEARRRVGRGPGTRGFLWKCPVCFCFYVDSLSDGISQCPRCNALHKKE